MLPPFVAALALELAPVRVNLIAAGFIDTPLSASYFSNSDELEKRREELRATLERQRIAIQTDLAASLPPIKGDPVQLQQVLVNLITNAAEAMRETTGRRRIVTIRSRCEGAESVLVSVEDTGVGLDPQNIDRIFDSFYTTKPAGIGLGLAISRSIIEAHHGK